jgi:hypothetical protein
MEHDFLPAPPAFADSSERPHYFGYREIMALYDQWTEYSPHMLSMAMGQHSRLGADAMLLHDISPDIFRMIHSKMIALPSEYSYALRATQGGRFVEHNMFPIYEEFLRVDSSKGWWQTGGWNLLIRLPILDAIIYDGPICNGIQYVSPVAVGSHARLELKIMPRPLYLHDSIDVTVKRYTSTGALERLCYEATLVREDQPHTLPALPDLVELEVTLRPIAHMLALPPQ